MTRLVLFLVHNWPLKLAALVLSSLLYGVIILTQDSRESVVSVPIQPTGQAPAIVLVSNLGEVRQIRYFAPDEVGPVTSADFAAEVDLSRVTPRAGSVVVGVTVTPIDPRVTVLSWEPRQVNISIDELVTRTAVPIRVVRDGEVPTGLEVRPARLDVDTVQVRGPSADVGRIDRVEAHVTIEPGGLDIDREVDLVAVDARGEAFPEVEVTPTSVRVQIPVLEDAETRSVAVDPTVTGEPAPGFEVESVSVVPLEVTIEGDGEQLEAVRRAETQPVSVAGATAEFSREVELVLPAGVLPVGPSTVRVTVTLRAVTGTRTFSAGVVPDGARGDRIYRLSSPSVLVTVGGSEGDLDRLEGQAFTAKVVVAGLEPGEHDVPVVTDLPAGLTVVSISPPNLTVTVSVPPGASVPPSPAPASP